MNGYIDEEDAPVDTELNSELGNVIRGSEVESVVAQVGRIAVRLMPTSPMPQWITLRKGRGHGGS